MTKPNINQKLINSLLNNPNTQRWNWIYDAAVDNCYLVPSPVPKDAKLFSLNDEISLYLNSYEEVVGVMIEYFSANFTEHKAGKGYKDILKLFTYKVDDIKSVKKENQDRAEIYKKSLVTDILQQIAVA